MELAMERCGEMHSKQKEQKAERPQESLAVVRKRKKAQEAGMKGLEMQISGEQRSSWKDQWAARLSERGSQQACLEGPRGTMDTGAEGRRGKGHVWGGEGGGAKAAEPWVLL